MSSHDIQPRDLVEQGSRYGIILSMSTEKLLREFVRRALHEEVRRKFEMYIPDDLRDIAAMFKSAGHQLFVVGGSVRDALLGKDPKDYDVATDAVPDTVSEILSSDPTLKVLEIGKSFGVVKVVTLEKNEYEIATFRKDIGAGRRPDAVEFTSIETDVLRRDLTINALFYDIDAGEIVDYVGGISDIERGVVKAVGNAAERFAEDRLRILRALRFAARMGSRLDAETDSAIKNDNKLTGVSPERIRDEFLKGILSAQSVPNFLGMIEEYDLWSQIFPGMPIAVTSANTKNVPVLLATLLIGNDPMVVAKKLNVLKYNAVETAQVSFLLRFMGLRPENAFRMNKMFKSSHLTPDDLLEFSEHAHEPGQQLVDAFVEYEPKVTGDQLMSQGFTGQALGKEMERLETQAFKELLR